MEDAAENAVCGGAEGDQEVQEQVDGPGPAGRWEMWAGSLDVLSSTEVGRLVPPLKEEDAAGSAVSGWGLRERREREEEREA